MFHTYRMTGAVALGCLLTAGAPQARATSTDYRFELAGMPQPSGGKDVVQVRLVRTSNGQPVAEAVIIESRADMGAGMESMTAPVTPGEAKGGMYTFDVAPSMTGKWVLHLSAMVQGEAEPVHGDITADLVK